MFERGTAVETDTGDAGNFELAVSTSPFLSGKVSIFFSS
jgi:hypothetical protein